MLLVLAALIVGPKKAVEMGRDAGLLFGRLKGTRDSLLQQVQDEIHQAIEPVSPPASKRE